MKSQKKLLLIDDSVELCNELAELFQEEGFDVDQTSDSDHGADLIKKNRYDVCLLDYKMKGLNGIDLLKMVKVINPECAAFIISGRSSIEELIEREQVMSLVAGIIKKPFDIELLLQQVKTAK